MFFRKLSSTSRNKKYECLSKCFGLRKIYIYFFKKKKKKEKQSLLNFSFFLFSFFSSFFFFFFTYLVLLEPIERIVYYKTNQQTFSGR